MTTNFSFPERRRSILSGATAFTLIELLVVISIIAVLAGLLLPVISKVTENAKKVSAKSTETQVVAAVNNYQTEYGQYPVVPPSTATDTTFDGTGGTSYTGHSNFILFNVLRALNTAGGDPTGTLNSRRIVYYEGRNVKNNTTPRDGFVTVSGTPSANGYTSSLSMGDLVDPWGNEYLIRIDTGYSNAVMNPYSEGSTVNLNSDDTQDQQNNPTDVAILHTGVIAWSYGTDGKFATNGTAPTTPFTAVGDDVISWQ